MEEAELRDVLFLVVEAICKLAKRIGCAQNLTVRVFDTKVVERELECAANKVGGKFAARVIYRPNSGNNIPDVGANRGGG